MNEPDAGVDEHSLPYQKYELNKAIRDALEARGNEHDDDNSGSYTGVFPEAAVVIADPSNPRNSFDPTKKDSPLFPFPNNLKASCIW